jgi:hypothetical protein
MLSYAHPVSFRTLLATLLALAVFLSPAVTSVAAAHAAVSDHQMQMMESGHCESAPSGHHEKSDGKSCCISVFVGLAVDPAAPLAEPTFLLSPPMYFLAAFNHPYLSEIATPPPRHS